MRFTYNPGWCVQYIGKWSHKWSCHIDISSCLYMPKDLKWYINNKLSLQLARKYARIFVRGHYLFLRSRKTGRYSEQIMSKDKYPSIFSPQMEAIFIIILQIFYATRSVLKIGEYFWIFPRFSWGIFTHVTRLDQSCASENIWWIITSDIPQF